jgi:feruloyl-CoA synthase
VFPENTASRALLKGLGFEEIGIHRRHGQLDGRWRDCVSAADLARYEARVAGPSVMPGYLDQPELTRQAFDEEGYYRMGDALAFVDRARPEEGLAFAGRIAEEFKLQSGIFVRAGALRVEAVSALGPLVSDVVVTGADRPYVGLLIWLNAGACAERFGIGDLTRLIGHAPLYEALRERLRRYNDAHSGGSMRVRRALLLSTPPSMDAGEITDKGYVNQRAALARRAREVELLYADAPPAHVLVLQPETP